jgi:hypothetical protein
LLTTEVGCNSSRPMRKGAIMGGRAPAARRGDSRAEQLKGRRTPTRVTEMVRPAWRSPLALFWGGSSESLGGLTIMRESGLASKNFCEFVGTFAGDRKALVGAPPLPSSPDLVAGAAATWHELLLRAPKNLPLLLLSSRCYSDRTSHQWALRAWPILRSRQLRGAQGLGPVEDRTRKNGPSALAAARLVPDEMW